MDNNPIDENISFTSAIANNNLDVVKYLVKQGADINSIIEHHRNIIFGGKIWMFYRNQKLRKRILCIRNELIPIYYHPEMKGGYFAKKDINSFFGDI